MKAMLAKLLDRPKFFHVSKVTTRQTMLNDNYNPLSNSGLHTLNPGLY